MLPRSIQKFISAFAALPSIGPRQATRLAFYLVSLGSASIVEIAGGPPPTVVPDPATNPCLLLGVREGARDSYSVLASFGGHFSASANKTDGATAGGGVSQYFATGMAAQLLALNGGAAVVSSGPAADCLPTTRS